jgi:hypothetical protein
MFVLFEGFMKLLFDFRDRSHFFIFSSSAIVPSVRNQHVCSSPYANADGFHATFPFPWFFRTCGTTPGSISFSDLRFTFNPCGVRSKQIHLAVKNVKTALLSISTFPYFPISAFIPSLRP